MNAPVPHLRLETVAIDSSDDPLWYKDAVIYQLTSRRSSTPTTTASATSSGLTAKLDYMQDLGVNTIWLLPFYPSPLRDDGYDIADYEDVHPHYGTLADFKAIRATRRTAAACA